MSAIAKKLAALGIVLPTPSAPVAAYVPYTVAGNLVFIFRSIADGKRAGGG